MNFLTQTTMGNGDIIEPQRIREFIERQEKQLIMMSASHHIWMNGVFYVNKQYHIDMEGGKQV